MSQPSSPDKQAIPAVYAGRSQERKVAFCVGLWNADSILYAWTYAKQYFLRVWHLAGTGGIIAQHGQCSPSQPQR